MDYKSKHNRPIAIDLFSGAGGLSFGFEQAGFDVLAAVELDPIHASTYSYNFPNSIMLCRNIIDITGKDIRSLASINNKEIDIIFGGPPCQGFSTIGKKLVDDSRNTLVFQFIRLVSELKPKYFCLENVPGILRGTSRKLFLEVINNFIASGYQIVEPYQILNAANYGVPQHRERLFLIGCRKGLNNPCYPEPITRQPLSKNSGLPVGHTVFDAIADLPEVENYPELFNSDSVQGKYGKPSCYASQLRGFSLLDDDYSYPRNHDSRLLTSSLRTNHNSETIKRFKATACGEVEPISRFLKLHPQGISNTLRAGTARDRGSHTAARPIHYSSPRVITVREAARLHSYSDWFRFHVTKAHGFRQIGNSVPPLLAKAVASEIIKALGIAPTKPTEVQALGDEKLLSFNMSQAAKYHQVSPHAIEPRVRKAKLN